MEQEVSKVELEHLTSWTSALTNKLEVMFFKILFFFYGGHCLKSLLNLLQYRFCFMFWFFGLEAGIEPTPPALEGEVVTPGLPGKSQAGNT